MFGLIDDLWQKFNEMVAPIATNLCIGSDTPNDRLTLLFIAAKCGIIELDGSDAKFVDDMMLKNATTGHIEGRLASVFDDPDFKAIF